MAAHEEARWIPIKALPLDLQLKLLRTASPVEVQRFRRARVPPRWQRNLAVLSLVIAGFHILFVRDVGGFDSTWRAGWLLAGAVLAARHLTWRRAIGFRAENGRQMVLGPASLVLVDGHNARVIPAESLMTVMDDVKLGEEIVARLSARNFGASDWPERLQRVISAARDRPELREEDRFRQAAGRARALSSFDVLWSRHEASLVAVGLALSAAVFLEAGPLNARAERAQAIQAEASALPQRMGELREHRKRTLAAVKEAVGVAEARRRRDHLREVALAGGLGEARVFLAEFGPGDEARPRLQEKLRKGCAELVPDRPVYVPKLRLLRAMALGACQSPGHTLYFNATGDREVTASARSVLKDLVAAEAANLPDRVEIIKSISEEPGSEVYPHVRVVMSEAPGMQAWKIEITPIDALGQPVKDAGFTMFRR